MASEFFNRHRLLPILYQNIAGSIERMTALVKQSFAVVRFGKVVRPCAMTYRLAPDGVADGIGRAEQVWLDIDPPVTPYRRLMAVSAFNVQTRLAIRA
jgi:hypothetical protein